jgi:hypothetical protein
MIQGNNNDKNISLKMKCLDLGPTPNSTTVLQCYVWKIYEKVNYISMYMALTTCFLKRTRTFFR